MNIYVYIYIYIYIYMHTYLSHEELIKKCICLILPCVCKNAEAPLVDVKLPKKK